MPRRWSSWSDPSRSFGVVEGGEHPGPEPVADHRGRLQERTLGWFQRVEAGRDQRLHRVGHVDRRSEPSGSSFDVLPSSPRSSSMCTNSRAYNGLPPARRISELSRVVGHDRVQQQRAQELLHVLVGQGRQGQGRGDLGAARTPRRVLGEQFRSRRCTAQQRFTSRASVTRWSRNSSIAGSAQCRSSTTITRGAVSATSSRNRVQAANDSERSTGASPGFDGAHQGARRLLSQSRSWASVRAPPACVRRASATDRRSCPGPTPIRARTISSRARERDALAVGEASSAVERDVLGPRRGRVRRGRRPTGSCRCPGSPDHRGHVRAPRLDGVVHQVVELPALAIATHERRRIVFVALGHRGLDRGGEPHRRAVRPCP